MIDPETINTFVTTLAGFLSSLGIITGAIYQWVWKPWAKRKEEKEEDYRQTMKDIASGKIGPISKQVESIEEATKRHDETDEKLMKILDEMRMGFDAHNTEATQRDILIKQNIDLLRTMKDQLDHHSDRLLLLEYVSGIRPGYEKGDSNGQMDPDE